MSRRWLRFGVKPQVSGPDLAGYSTAKLIRSEGSTTRLKSQTKRKTENPPMCCCVADAITTEHNYLKRHNEKFEMVVNIGGSSSRVTGKPSARFSLALHVDDCAFVPPSYEIQKKKPATSSSKSDLFPGTVRHYGGSSSSSRGRREDLEQEQGTKSASTRSTTLGLPCVRS
jgi:hypothetical protein